MLRVDDVRRAPELTKRIIRSLARHQDTQVTVETICADIEKKHEDALRHLFLAHLHKIEIVSLKLLSADNLAVGRLLNVLVDGDTANAVGDNAPRSGILDIRDGATYVGV